jgi:PAS domain S-box-containing protein
MSDSHWIDRADCAALRSFIRHCHVPVIVSGIDGSVLWANDEFCEWSGYTVRELQMLGWKKLSIDNEHLTADIEAAKELNGYNLTYKVQKQYIPKNDKPHWGTLSVMRYPATGDIEFCVCIWMPLKNGTQAAFNMAMTELGKLASQMEACKGELSNLAKKTDEDVFLSSGVKLIKSNPKIFWAVLVVTLGLFGFNNVLQILSGLHLVPTPIVPYGGGK